MAELDLSRITGEGEGCEPSFEEDLVTRCVELSAFQLARTVDGSHDQAGIVMAGARDVMELLDCDPATAHHVLAVGIATASIVERRKVRDARRG